MGLAEGFAHGFSTMLGYIQQQKHADEEHRQFERSLDMKKLELEHQARQEDRMDKLYALQKAGQEKEGAQFQATFKRESFNTLANTLTDLHRQRWEAQSYGQDTSEIDADLAKTRGLMDRLTGLPGMEQPQGASHGNAGQAQLSGTAGRMQAGQPTSMEEADQLLKDTGMQSVGPAGTGAPAFGGPPGVRTRYGLGARSTKSPLEQQAAEEKAKTDIISERAARKALLEKEGVPASTAEVTNDPGINNLNQILSRGAIPIQIQTGVGGPVFMRYQAGGSQRLESRDVIENPEIARSAATAMAAAKSHGQASPELVEAYKRDVVGPSEEAAMVARSGIPAGATGYDRAINPNIRHAEDVVDSANGARQAYEFATGGRDHLPELTSPVTDYGATHDLKRFTNDFSSLTPEQVKSASTYLLQQFENPTTTDEQGRSELERPETQAALKSLAQQMSQRSVQSAGQAPTGTRGSRQPGQPNAFSSPQVDPGTLTRWGVLFDRVGITVPMQKGQPAGETGAAQGVTDRLKGLIGLNAKDMGTAQAKTQSKDLSTLGERRAGTKPPEINLTDNAKLGETLLSQYARGSGLRSIIGTTEKTDYAPIQNWIARATPQELKEAKTKWAAMARDHSTPEALTKQVDQLLSGGEARQVTGQPKHPYQPTFEEKQRGAAYQKARSALNQGGVEDFAGTLDKIDTRELKLLYDDIESKKGKVKDSVYRTWKKTLESEIMSRRKR